LALLRAVDTVQADAFGAIIVQDFDGVAVEDGDDGAGKIGEGGEAPQNCHEYDARNRGI